MAAGRRPGTISGQPCRQESAEALAGMGTALWWLGRVRESLTYRERAYAGYVAQLDYLEAAMVAIDVSVSYLSNLDNSVVAGGWLARARRAAEQGGDPSALGWLWLMRVIRPTTPTSRWSCWTGRWTAAGSPATSTWSCRQWPISASPWCGTAKCRAGSACSTRRSPARSAAHGIVRTPSSGPAAACWPPAVWSAISGVPRPGVGRSNASPRRTDRPSSRSCAAPTTAGSWSGAATGQRPRRS